MRLGRLLRMTPPEIAGRGLQQGRKWLDRARGAAAGMTPQPARDGATPRPAGVTPGRDAADGLRRFRDDGARFFAGAVHAATPDLLSERMPEERRLELEEAERIRAGRFDLLGYRDLVFGDPIDWRLDPVSGRRSRLVHWSRLDPLDPHSTGDSKVVWELNRHQWLVRLAQAYRLTGDDAPARLCVRRLAEWMDANPPGLGINWASSLEVALRLISWSWTLHLLRDSEALTPDLFMRIADGMTGHASHVERYLSRYFSPNTHLTGEALGLLYAGVVLPDRPAAARWRGLGAGILAEECGRQVLDDGVYFEQSTCYQIYTIEILLHALILGERSDVEMRRALGPPLQRMFDFLLAARGPDGSIPAIGDADGGRLLPLAARRSAGGRREPGGGGGADTAAVAAHLFSTAAALFGRGDYAWAAGRASAETLWLLGPAGVEAFDALSPAPPSSPPTRLFPSGGYVVMRSDWSPGAHHLIFDVGPLGCPRSAGHGHADLLSVQCSAFGRAFLCDPGTYGYTPEPRWRDHFRSTAAHSTVVVDGAGQAEPRGPFAWRGRPRARLRRFVTGADFDFADADHDAYLRLPDPVRHRRRVLFARRGWWVLVDDLDGASEHDVEIRFQFAPMVVTVSPDLRARAYGRGRADLHLLPFASAPLQAAIHERQETPIAGWFSPDYGRRQGAPMLVYKARARLPLRVLTLLWPSQRADVSVPRVTPLLDEAGRPIGLRFEKPGERVVFDDDGFVVESA